MLERWTVMNKQIGFSYSPISWMAQNHVAANLLMLMMVAAGVFYVQNIRQEIQPNYTFATVIIEMSYPGASPEEIEGGIVLAIEASIKSIEGLEHVVSTAIEGKALVYADIADDENLDRVLQSVRNAIDGITSFPKDAERPIIRLDDDARWLTTFGISGATSEKETFELYKQIKSDLLEIDGIIQVIPRIKKVSEISIEIPQAALNSLNLTIPEIAQSIESSASDMPSGKINTLNSQYILRTEGRKERGRDFYDIPLKTDVDGSLVTIGDIAVIKDGFKQSPSLFSYNGSEGMIIYVYQSKNSRTIELGHRVHKYIEGLSTSLPESIKLDFPYQRIDKYQKRMNMLIDNGVAGLLLVVLILGIFLNPRLAFWVAVSIPVVYVSSFTILYYLDISINMISMFAFIMTLGIVVDDAIIVGENIHSKRQQGLTTRDAVIHGVNEMFLPVLFAVTTNIIAFIPLLMMKGDMGEYMRSLPIVAVVVFVVSLIEALFILPAHLNVKKSKFEFLGMLKPLQHAKSIREKIAKGLDNFRDNGFQRILLWSINHRYITVVIFTGGLLLTLAWFLSNRIDFQWYPRIPSDQVSAKLQLPPDASSQDLILKSKRIEAAGLEAIKELGDEEDLQSRSISAGINSPNFSKINFDLVNENERNFSQMQFVTLWRKKVGKMLNVQSLSFDYLVGFGSGAGIFVDMRHSSNKVLEIAARELAKTMKTIEGLVDVTDGLSQGKNQLKYTLTNQAKSLGITESEFSSQMRGAFFGIQAIRMLRDQDEVNVWVRLPPDERDSLIDLENFTIRSPSGIELPLSLAANKINSKAFTSIKRENGRRIIQVGGVMDPNINQSYLAKQLLIEEIIPALIAKYPGLQAGISGSLGTRNGQTTLSKIGIGLSVSSIILFVLLASLFSSYTQGFIVILTIPYCIAAAVIGHIIMGYSLTANSIFGMTALGGIVLNGSFVLTLRMNQLVKKGRNSNGALIEATISRFRPIVLTSLTTTVGLLPILFETSQQALFLVPFAIALSFGTIVSTFVILILIPTLHAIHSDICNRFNS